MIKESSHRCKWHTGQRIVLVEAGSVGVLVFLDDGDNKCDEFGPEVQILDAWSLLLWRHGALLGLE